MDSDYDDLEALHDEQETSRYRWMTYVVLLLAVAGFFSLAWYAYYTGTKTTDGEETLLVEADRSPVKEVPENPGGQEFPHQDKTIYDALSDRPAASRQVENLMPEPEEPQSDNTNIQTWVSDAPKQPVAAAPVASDEDGETTESANADTAKTDEDKSDEAKSDAAIERTKQDAASVTTVGDAPVAETGTAMAPKIIVEPKKPETATTVPEVAVKAEPAKPVAKQQPKAATPAATGSKEIQLGAFKSEAEANSHWQKLLAAHGGVLKGHSARVMKADLGEKGIFYRLRSGGFQASSAKAACASLAAKKQACFVVGG